MQEPHNLTDDDLYNRRNAARATLDEWEEQGYLSNDPEDEIETTEKEPTAMTSEQIAFLCQQELELLGGWMRYRDLTQNREGVAGRLRLAAADEKIAECNARLDKLERMGAKPCTRQSAS